jgi:deazaflavin-dependent oxidoreductase (nitroreductase family)
MLALCRQGRREDMSNFNTTIIEQFRANGGRGEFDGVPLILLHHVGAKSGTERVTPVVCYPQFDGRFAIIASNGGAPTSPDWYCNLNSHRTIDVEFGGEMFAAAARELEGREREKVWADALRAAPQLDEHQKKTSRTFPVVLLARIS